MRVGTFSEGGYSAPTSNYCAFSFVLGALNEAKLMSSKRATTDRVAIARVEFLDSPCEPHHACDGPALRAREDPKVLLGALTLIMSPKEETGDSSYLRIQAYKFNITLRFRRSQWSAYW